MTTSIPEQCDGFADDEDSTAVTDRHRYTDPDEDITEDGSDTDAENPERAAPVSGTRTGRRQRRQDRRVQRLVSVRELHIDLAPSQEAAAVVVRPPKGVGRHARNLWRTLEAQRVREQMGDSRWVRNPPRWLGSRGRREFLQAERAAVRTKMRIDAAPGGVYTAQEQQRGALVLALLLSLLPLLYLLSSCGA